MTTCFVIISSSLINHYGGLESSKANQKNSFLSKCQSCRKIVRTKEPVYSDSNSKSHNESDVHIMNATARSPVVLIRIFV